MSLPSFYTVSLSTDSGPGSPDSNYLRVAQSLAGRRLSDNVIGNNSGNRGRPAPSSSVHLSPATCLSVGSLPTRRHSSIGSTDRRPSTANLLPPSVIVYIYVWHHDWMHSSFVCIRARPVFFWLSNYTFLDGVRDGLRMQFCVRCRRRNQYIQGEAITDWSWSVSSRVIRAAGYQTPARAYRCCLRLPSRLSADWADWRRDGRLCARPPSLRAAGRQRRAPVFCSKSDPAWWGSFHL